MKKQRIYIRNSILKEEELTIAKLLIKCGYTVRLGTDKSTGKPLKFIEYWEEV